MILVNFWDSITNALIPIGIICLLVLELIRYKEFVNVREILLNHFFIELGDKKRFNIMGLLWSVPLALLLSYKLTFSDGYVSLLLTASAILTGFMFNMLVLNVDLLKKHNDKVLIAQISEKRALENESVVLKNMFYDVSSAILFTILLLSVLLFEVLGAINKGTNTWCYFVYKALVLFLVIEIVKILLKTLKQIYLVVEKILRSISSGIR